MVISHLSPRQTSPHSSTKPDTYSTPQNKQSFLLPPNPLNKLIGSLRQRVPAHAGPGNAVDFESRCHPGERGAGARDGVIDFQMRVFGMHSGVEGGVD